MEQQYYAYDVTYKWRADLIQRQAVVKAAFIQHARHRIARVGRSAIAWRPNKQPIQTLVHREP